MKTTYNILTKRRKTELLFANKWFLEIYQLMMIFIKSIGGLEDWSWTLVLAPIIITAMVYLITIIFGFIKAIVEGIKVAKNARKNT